MAVLNESDGLIHHEFNRLSSFKSQTGQLYFGSLAGLNEINPQKVKQQLKASEKTKIYISRLSYFDEESKQTVNIRNFQPNSSPLNLPAEQRFLSVKLGMSNYGEMARSRYAYRLNGLQKDWNYMGSEHLIRLPNLPSGKYILEIAGIDHKGNWTSNTIQIPIRAEEYFYKQAWFYILCAIPFLTFAFLWIRRLRSEKYRLEKEVDKRTLEIRQDKELIQQQASELQQLDQMKSRFFANISHDLRTPITLISGPAELLAEEDYVKEKSAFHKAVVTIGKNSKKLLRLIDEILDLARLESKTVKLHEEVIPVVEFAQSIFDTYALEAQHKKLQFELIAEVEEQMELLVDPNRLEKIINNLLSNALKFTASGDHIQLHIFKEQEQVIFEVADTGRGIPAEDLPHVFERFFQSKNQDLVQTSGSGIGLSLCQDFAKLMKGSLSVNSTFGQGSTFRLSLPLKQGQAGSTWQSTATKISDIQASKNIPSTSSPTKTSKLMIVEDNVEVQGFLQQLLAPDYEVLTFDDGQAALDFLSANKNKSLPVDLILSDINMPRLDGYGLVEALKKEEQWQQIPLIMLTARTKERSKLQALRMGVDDYLTKPFSPIELKVRIENILGNYQKRIAFQKDYLKVNPQFEASPSADQVWLKDLETYALEALEKRIDLTAGHLAVQLNIGERQLARKVKLLTGLTIGKYITEVKLQKARHLVEERSYSTIAEIGYASGFRSPSYFTKVFTDYFGKTPTAYQ
jgi:signal transduction histidine kinase/DNA-binding response OmpR family regulator